jgi:hypothetical protein
MSLNKAGNRVTFVDPPVAVVNSLALSLRTAFPHQIADDDTLEDGVFRIVLKSGIDGAQHLSPFTVSPVFFSYSIVMVAPCSNAHR